MLKYFREHGMTYADVNASLNMLRVYAPTCGDGLKVSPTWGTYEWDKHSWLPRAKSLDSVSVPLPIVKTEKWVVFGGLACGYLLHHSYYCRRSKPYAASGIQETREFSLCCKAENTL